MAAFAKFEGTKGVKGESTDSEHRDQVLLQTMSAPVHRSIPEGAKDQQRMRGETTMGDVVMVRELDLSSVGLQEACADGTLFTAVTIHFTTQLAGKNKTYLEYVLENVIVTGYSLHAHHSGQPLPTEEVTLNYTKARWKYTKWLQTDKSSDPQNESSHGSFDVGAQEKLS